VIQIIGEQAAQLAALVKGHVHNFEGYVSRAVIAEQRRDLEAAEAKSHFELLVRAWSHVTVEVPSHRRCAKRSR
jgi:hypothetical protein